MYIAFIVILVLAGLFFGLKFTQVTENNDPVMAVLFKGLTTVCCIVIAAIAVFHTTDRHFAVLLMFGLFFGFLGDELLALRFVFTEKFSLCFLSGAMSFLVGHVFYVIALYSIAPKAWIAAIPLLIIAMLLEYQNSKKHDLKLGKLYFPLAGYCAEFYHQRQYSFRAVLQRQPDKRQEPCGAHHLLACAVSHCAERPVHLT